MLMRQYGRRVAGISAGVEQRHRLVLWRTNHGLSLLQRHPARKGLKWDGLNRDRPRAWMGLIEQRRLVHFPADCAARKRPSSLFCEHLHVAEGDSQPRSALMFQMGGACQKTTRRCWAARRPRIPPPLSRRSRASCRDRLRLARRPFWIPVSWPE
jgi:hypothetical protein